MRAVVREYLTVAHWGDPPGDFGDTTPFMEAGLDSLDLLKVRPSDQMYCMSNPNSPTIRGKDKH